MRIDHLRLIRYGHFEGQELSFPESEHDIHVVYGDNEAGKTTVLSAMSDVLFRIPERTEYGFKHGMAKLRIGVTLKDGDDEFSFVRYKKRNATIYDDDGTEILDGEKALRRILGSADRDFFERMFLLDHHRFAAGSKALLASSGDAGEAMLGASAGLEGLHELLETLKAESADLWTPNKSMKRKFYVAKAALDAATKAKRESVVETREWKKVNQAVDDARAAHEALQGDIREKRIAKTRLDRVRRLHGELTKLTAAEKALSELGKVVLMPEDAAESLRQARTEKKLVENKIDMHDRRIKTLEDGIAELTIEDAVLSLADEIHELNERRVQLLPHREDIPRRIDERDVLGMRSEALTKELGWSPEGDDVLSLVPGRPVVDRARNLVTEHATQIAEHNAANKAYRIAESEEQRLGKRVESLSENIELTPLRKGLREAIAARQVAQDRQRIAEDLAAAGAELDKAMAALSAGIEDEAALAAAVLPIHDSISDHRDSVRSGALRLQEAREARRKTSRRAESLRKDIEEKHDALEVMSDADLAEARETRDQVWKLLSVRYVHGKSYREQEWSDLLGDDEVGDQGYEKLVATADEGADVRFANARDVGEIVSQEKALDELERELSGLDDDIAALLEEFDSLDRRWSVFWEESPVVPSDPDQGLAWLDQAIHCKDLLEQRSGLAARYRTTAEREQGNSEALLKELVPLADALDTAGPHDLEHLIAIAQETVETIGAKNTKADALRETHSTAISAVSNATNDVDITKAAMTEWSTKWTGVLATLNLDATVTPDALEGHLKLLDELRECLKKIEDLQTERIDKMTADLSRYEKDVSQHAEALGASKSGNDVDEIVKSLVRRLQQSVSHQEQREQNEFTIAEERKTIEDLVDDQQGYVDTISRLADLTGTEDEEALQKAAHASDQRRSLEAEIEQLTAAIEKNGDNKSLDELREEAKGEDLDTAIALLQELEEELTALEGELPEQIEALHDAEGALKSIGEEGEAAAAEWQRQQALADLGDVAERFVRTSTASTLLQWSIDRFRTKNQKPLLDKASVLFSIITRGSFERVVIEYDDDTPVLAGRRPNGDVTPLSGMSSGSSDQLYLALRLAAIEDFTEKSSAMPFVGDDLFIQHDKKRTKEALCALAELSKTCQVILFSHDEGFADLASKVLPKDANLVTIEIPSPA